MSGHERSRAERRMIRRMERRGGRGFWIWRSREVGIKRYVRTKTATEDQP